MKILYLFYIICPLLFLIAGLRIYKSKGRRAAVFFRRMAYNGKMRKVYCRLLFSVNTFGVLLYSMILPSQIDFIPATLLLVFLISTKRTEKMLEGIRNSRGVMVLMLVVFVLFLRYPPLLPCGIIIGSILCFSLFYPSADVMKDEELREKMLERERIMELSVVYQEEEGDEMERTIEEINEPTNEGVDVFEEITEEEKQINYSDYIEEALKDCEVEELKEEGEEDILPLIQEERKRRIRIRKRKKNLDIMFETFINKYFN